MRWPSTLRARGASLPLRLTMAVVLASVASACGDSGTDATGPPPPPDEVRRIGVFAFGDLPDDVLRIPANAVAGVELTAVITTMGDGCVRLADEEIFWDGRIIKIVPYDFTQTGMACPQLVQYVHHQVPLRFEREGDYLVQAYGQQIDAGEARIVSVEQWVTVEPPPGPKE